MDDEEARAVLRDHGEEPTKRGRLSKAARDRAEELAGFGPQPATEPKDAYDGGVNAEDFGPDVTEAGEPPAVVAEVKPRRVKSSKPNLRERLRTKPNAKARPKHRRVPVDRLISRGWELLGGLAGRVDVPLGRVVMMQAPVAGLIMEDIVAGTVADKVMQPIARAEDKAEKGLALVAPPLCVLGLEMVARLPDDQRKVREAILWPLLVESMVLWSKIAGEKAEDLAARAEREAPARAQAEELARLIFAEPVAQVPEPEAAASA